MDITLARAARAMKCRCSQCQEEIPVQLLVLYFGPASQAALPASSCRTHVKRRLFVSSLILASAHVIRQGLH